MLQTITIDPKTIVIKADDETDIADILEYVSQKLKQRNMDSFLSFAAQHRTIDENYTFNRSDCYD